MVSRNISRLYARCLISVMVGEGGFTRDTLICYITAGFKEMRNYRYQGFQLTPILAIIGLNLVLFFITQFDRVAAYRLLGLTPALVITQPWTIITSMFMHAGFRHIFFNMLALYFFGTYLSGIIGDKKFLWVYFGGGILGGILYTLLAPPFIPAIGASGAVFAIAGTLVVLNPRIRVLLFFILPVPLWVAVILGLLIISPGIAWEAHLGGLLFGLAAGYIFRREMRRRYW